MYNEPYLHKVEATRILMRTYGKPTSNVPVSVLVKRLANPFRNIILEILAVFVKNICIPKYQY